MNTPRVTTVLLAAALAGCAPERRVVEVEDTRVVEARLPRLGATSAERFGGMRSRFQAPVEPPTAVAPGFGYDLPSGWTELPPQRFRDVNLAGPGGVKSWVTLLGAGAGGPLANLNRWRRELSLPPASAVEVQALPRTKLLGQDASRVDITSPDGEQRMIATMMFASDRSVFLRMSGPAAAVAAQTAAYDALEASLRDANVSASVDRDPPTRGGGAVEPPIDDGVATATEAGGFGWEVPTGWVGLGPGPGKTFEFQVGPARCWLTDLSGDGGGLQANVARWCGQIGHEPLTVAEVAALPTLEVLGEPATYVVLLGDGAAEGLLGVIAPLEGRTLFVKLVGPSAALRAHKSEFERFCASLTVKG